MPGRSVRDSPAAPLVAFSAATNLGIAGRAVRVDEQLPGADGLRALLRGFGARFAEPAEVAFVADVDATAALGAVVIVGVGPQRLGRTGGRGPRPGVESREDGTAVVRGLPEPVAGAAGARIDWARAWMRAAGEAAAELGDLARGVRIGVSMVLEPKTAVLALLLQEAGALVDVFAFAAETDDAVAAELRARGIAVHASAGATPEQERAFALALLDAGPRVLVDDGAHVIRLAHAVRPEALAGLAGAAEETTSGVVPLRAMTADGALRVPVIAANDAGTKSVADNRHGTGETCVLAIVRALDDDLAGSRAVVIGFGPVGAGVAQRLAALGAVVTVVDRDPRRALAARLAGYGTAEVLDAVATADLVVSATGTASTVDASVLDACRDDAAIAVAGGAPEEVLLPAGVRRERIDPHVERVHLAGGGRVRLLAGGDCVNIVAGEGNPIDVMDLSFAVQLVAIRRLLERPGALPPGVHPLGAADDAHVAALALGMAGGSEAVPASVDWRRTRFDLDRPA